MHQLQSVIIYAKLERELFNRVKYMSVFNIDLFKSIVKELDSHTPRDFKQRISYTRYMPDESELIKIIINDKKCKKTLWLSILNKIKENHLQSTEIINRELDRINELYGDANHFAKMYKDGLSELEIKVA